MGPGLRASARAVGSLSRPWLPRLVFTRARPEENLDPKSVFDVLVRYFRQVRRLRQFIIVTHSPNLVVNTDADQIIVASASPRGDGALPTVNYVAGALEDDEIRSQVCSILEGGQRAFKERERRYRLAPRLPAEPEVPTA